MLEALDELRERVINGEVCSLAVQAEVTGQGQPRFVFLGRFEQDPFRALLALERAGHSLHRQLDRAANGGIGYKEGG